MEALAPDSPFQQIMATTAAGEEIILVKVNGNTYGWRNSCPHVGVGLDYGDGDCLTEEGTLICSMHGALFEPDTGRCIAGPCAGDQLQQVPIRIEDGQVWLCTE